MENLNGTDTEYLLQSSLEDLHQVSKYWLDEIEFWKTELVFFQDLLDKFCPNIHTSEDKKQLDHFQNLIIYYNGELLDEYNRKIRKHTKMLARLMAEEQAKIEDMSFREQHRVYGEEVSAMGKRLQEYKTELFEFIQTIW
jgi:hypothetical protein